MNTSSDIWVFGYGSLMWKPGFDFIQASRACLNGYHRDLCILSYVYRGTREKPGLVMGLNQGGQCEGRAFKVAADNTKIVMDYLHEREMPNNVYKPQWVSLDLENGESVEAYTFVADEDHLQHVGSKPMEEKIGYLLQGIGTGGTALEYLENTLNQLRDWQIQDQKLEAFLSAARKMQENQR